MAAAAAGGSSDGGGLHLVDMPEFVKLLMRCAQWVTIEVFVSPAVDEMHLVGKRLSPAELNVFQNAVNGEVQTTMGFTVEQADTVWRWASTLSNDAYAHPSNPAWWLVTSKLTPSASQQVYALEPCAPAAAAAASAAQGGQTTLKTRKFTSVKTSNFAKHRAYEDVLGARMRDEFKKRIVVPHSENGAATTTAGVATPRARPQQQQPQQQQQQRAAPPPPVAAAAAATASSHAMHSAEMLWTLAHNVATAQLQLQMYQHDVALRLSLDLARSIPMQPPPRQQPHPPSLAQQRRTAGAAAAAAAAEADDVAARAFRYHTGKP